MNTYTLGTEIRITLTVTDAEGTGVDPSTIVMTTLAPDGSESEYTYAEGDIVRSAQGSFYRDVTLDLAGIWEYRFVTTGPIGAAEDKVKARATRFG